MKNKVFNLMLFLTATLWLTCCRKEKPEPQPKDPCPWPEITTEGLHTLGFKINGKEWVPCADLYAIAATNRPIDAGLTESDGSNGLSLAGVYSMTSVDSISNSYGIAFRPLRIGKIPKEELENTLFTFSERRNGNFIDRWDLPASNEGLQIEILELDTSRNIISGIFEAILIPKYGTDTLRITDGRFDLKYYPQ